MRPYVICHMMASLDGRIDCEMTEQIDDTNHYYEALAGLDCPSTLEGKTTLMMHYAQDGEFLPQKPYEDAGQQLYKAVERLRVGDGTSGMAEGYAIGVDTRGTLLWDDNTTELFGRPLLMILSEQASQEYLDYLKQKHISYITTGRDSIDLASALETLRTVFGVERLAVVGGGHINGSLLDLGLIDEVSMMYGYGIDGREGMAAAFDGRPMERKPIRLAFKSVEEQDGIVWMRYQVINGKTEENMTTLNLTQEWDKTFPKSEKVNHSKVTFQNRYGITLAADLYEPKDVDSKLAAIAVSGPFGAVKEQCAGLYAQTLAERGFLTIAFDPSFTGESGGEPRYIASPDINTEDFLAAVDFLVTNPKVDAERVGILGICGWGGMAVNAAALDPRIKATVASTMYDISQCETEGYFGSENTAEQRWVKKRQLAELRTKDFAAGQNTTGAGLPDSVPDDAPQFLKDYVAYYKHHGRHPRSLNGSALWSFTGKQSFLNQPLLCWAHEIENPVLLIHGEKAHSRYFSETAFEKMTGRKVVGESAKEGNKEMMIIPGAVHCDLYDNLDVIPFDKIESFYRENLK